VDPSSTSSSITMPEVCTQKRARAAYALDGRTILTHRPPQPGTDFNDALVAGQTFEV
jgi:hypothetical protein